MGLANQGAVVVGVQEGYPHGHIVTARPTIGGFGSTKSKADPPVNNIGGTATVTTASKAFSSKRGVRWYRIKPQP